MGPRPPASCFRHLKLKALLQESASTTGKLFDLTKLPMTSYDP